jgi:hypothetical protein
MQTDPELLCQRVGTVENDVQEIDGLIENQETIHLKTSRTRRLIPKRAILGQQGANHWRAQTSTL